MRWRPGLTVYWRAPGESQVGIEGAHILTGLSPGEQELLDLLAAGATEPLEVVAARRGWTGRQVAALVTRLPSWALIEDGAPVVASPPAAAWSRWEAAGVERPRDRAGVCLQVDGLDALGLRIACLLAEGGIGRLVLADEEPVRPSDVRPGGYRGSEVGGPRAPAALALLRRLFPHLPLASADAAGTPCGDEGAADLVVMIDHGVSDPLRYRRYLHTDLPHLAVVVRELDVCVGPLVRPGHGPCLRCIELTRTDADDRWPVLATQLRGSGSPVPLESASAALAAALAAHQALAFADARPVALAATSYLVDAIHPVPRFRTWPVHPACGCAPESLDSGAQRAGHRGG
ncbi:ThiF family adenylyltransferase [Pseudactinotalea sp. HY160]|uniref:ThiF family adenylyltransferase n=1 Tax=Pseudactinotalea sp. HY160 TaxID=2654490 RepID=UPI0018841666|nr:ThiF family adenylyltransferase [Pseudactinotalea sp. HY160]